MPKADLRCATRMPIRPRPTTPSVFSLSSTPVYLLRFHSPFLSAVLAAATKAGVVLGDPVVGEGAVLDLGEDLLHLGLGGVVDDARTGDVVAPHGSLRPRPAHL